VSHILRFLLRLQRSMGQCLKVSQFKQFSLREADKLDWSTQSRDGKLVIVVTLFKRKERR